MSIDLYTARTSDVGGIPVARLLPNKGKKNIGAWCFLDHAGPARFQADEKGLQVGSHPHTNLQTFTWMLEGEVLHKDSLGNEQVISKNQVNLMTAGTGTSTGISHTEQSVSGDTGNVLHAVQLWIALPTDQNIQPSFINYPELPMWEDAGVRYTLTTGSYQSSEAHSHTAPTLQYSPLVGVDMQFDTDTEVNLFMLPSFEYGILVVEGEVEFNGTTYGQDELIRLSDCGSSTDSQAPAASTLLKGTKGTHLMLLGGEPLPHQTLIWWNFVASSKADIEQSITDWNNQHPRFGHIDTQLKRLVAPKLPQGFKG